MQLSHFILYTTIGAGLWNTILAAMGYALASVVPEDQLLDTVTRYSHQFGYAMIALAVVVVGYFIYKARKK
jgi:membrane protein DedA with SNARE-associated domain